MSARAARADAPAFIEPCVATLRDKAPGGVEWIHEIKFDGYRAQAHLDGANTTIYTRRGYDWTDRFEAIATSLRTLRIKRAIFDGEIIVPDERGASDFHRLQEDLARKRDDRFVYFIFDLMYLNGRDLRSQPLLERKAQLAKLLKKAGPVIRYSEHFAVDGAEMFVKACEMKLEGIVSKRTDSPYRSGRTENWIKTKCVKSETYPIVAFVEKLGANPRRIASMYLGRWEGGKLLYAGKAQTGFTQKALYDLRERLDPYIRKTSPLSVAVKKPKATWVEPVVNAEIQFSGITSDGLLRAPVYKGVRDDLAAKPQSSTRLTRSNKPAVPRENILQLLPDAVVPTKEELRAYWRKVAKQALKYLGRRPLKLVRSVHGTVFYHKGSFPPIPDSVHQLKVRKREGGEGVRLWVDDLEGLLGLVDIGAVELHPWNAMVDDIEHADQMVFDLDPGEGVAWDFVIETALKLRDVLDSAGLHSWPKLTGGKGIHLMVPLDSPMTHDAAHATSRVIASQLAATTKDRYTISANVSARRGRLFIDYLRNGRGTTAIGAWSPRTRPGNPIAVPVSWSDIERGMRADAFTMQALPSIRREAKKAQDSVGRKRTRARGS